VVRVNEKNAATSKKTAETIKLKQAQNDELYESKHWNRPSIHWGEEVLRSRETTATRGFRNRKLSFTQKKFVTMMMMTMTYPLKKYFRT
jgi:hypothetical protein